MIVEYIRYNLTHHKPAELMLAYEAAVVYLASAPECKAYELAQCTEDKNSFILRIHWISVEAHLKGFRVGKNFPPFLEAIKAFVPEIAEMRHYEVITKAGDAE